MGSNEIKVNYKNNYIVTQTIENFSQTSKDVSSFDIDLMPRSNRPLVCINKNDDQCVFFQEVITAKIENKKLHFSRPNEISLSMNIARKSLQKSQEIRKNILKNFSNEKSMNLFDHQVNDVYDYLEEVQKTIIFSYKAIESMCNSAIPEEYTYKNDLTKKGIYEVYDKAAIERWMSTTDKISKILPNIYNCTSPSKKYFWGHFKKLEELRNEIVHSKSSSTSKLLSELLSNDINKYFNSCESMLLYFYKLDKRNSLFPVMPEISEIAVIEWEDMESAFTVVED
ncbi:TPA: hypothetical protein ACGS5G_003153 [Escherichia coli]